MIGLRESLSTTIKSSYRENLMGWVEILTLFYANTGGESPWYWVDLKLYRHPGDIRITSCADKDDDPDLALVSGNGV